VSPLFVHINRKAEQNFYFLEKFTVSCRNPQRHGTKAKTEMHENEEENFQALSTCKLFVSQNSMQIAKGWKLTMVASLQVSSSKKLMRLCVKPTRVLSPR
jgi:hypothetical protein